MLFCPGLSSFLWTYTNQAATPVTSAAGTSVVPGASNAEGSWTQVASSANIADDVYWVFINVSHGVTANNSKPHLLDLGVDPAGGTSYSAVVSNMACGNSALVSSIGCGHNFYFPMFIPAGSAVAVRIQGANATAGTVRVCVKFYGRPSAPETMPVATFSETIGAITNSNGVSFTPGNAADGTWTSLGTTTNPLWWWQLCYQLDNSAVTAEACYIDLGVGDGTNFHVIKQLYHIGNTGEEVGSIRFANLMHAECYCPVPAGATMYVRGRANNAPDSGYNAVAVGFGG